MLLFVSADGNCDFMLLKPSVLEPTRRFLVSQFNQHKVKMDKQLLRPGVLIY